MVTFTALDSDETPVLGLRRTQKEALFFLRRIHSAQDTQMQVH